jgi:phosphatidylserine/phosphatidylglycerophosphate/cardiolipin synthase-like enzyme
MSLLIILRNKRYPNYFQKLMLDAIDSHIADNIILCSGFFQENSFSASFSTGLVQLLKKNNIAVTTIGVYNPIWKPQYIIFRDNLIACGISVNAKLTASYKWHAKIFILKKGEEPIFGIIGSSNMTSRAFGVCKQFNFEADVVLWDNKYPELVNLTSKSSEFLSGENNINDIIYADYDVEKNNQISIVERLKQLEKEIDIKNLKDL